MIAMPARVRRLTNLPGAAPLVFLSSADRERPRHDLLRRWSPRPYGVRMCALRPYIARFDGWSLNALGLSQRRRYGRRNIHAEVGGRHGEDFHSLLDRGRADSKDRPVRRRRDYGPCHEAYTADIRQAEDAVPTGYDGVIVGASVHMGKHDKHAVDYVRNNRTALEKLPSALFSVSLAAHGDTEEAAGYVEEFEHDTGWRPVRIALFGGALLYSQYGFLKRHMMKKVASGKPGNLDTDTSHDYVYTEWDGVQRFAEDFMEELTSGGVRKGSPRTAGRTTVLSRNGRAERPGGLPPPGRSRASHCGPVAR